MDVERLERLFEKYPKLENFIAAGNITLKAARTILGFAEDRHLMYDIYAELLEIGAVEGTGAVSWRATPELKTYMKERKACTT